MEHSPSSLNSPADAEARIRQMLDQGQTFLAHDLAQSALRQFPESVGLRQALALALLRAGALGEAETALSRLAEVRDEETLGLHARIHKERWRRSGAPEDARLARDAYGEAFRASRGSWTGINAATLSWIIGEWSRSAALAAEVLGILGRTPLPSDEAERYWHTATQAEALLLRGRPQEATAYCTEAAALAGRRHASVAATRRQMELLATHGFRVPDAMLYALRPPSVVVFAGHMLDRPDRSIPRFPAEAEVSARCEISQQLDAMGARIGFSAAACGADILFLEAMQERGAETHIVLPYAQEDFLQSSVAFAGPAWIARFHQALGRADSVRYVTEESVAGDRSVSGLMPRMLAGYAALAASILGAIPTLLALWDGGPGPAGGTADQVASWPGPSPPVIIPLTASIAENASPPSLEIGQEEPIRRQIKTLLFADVVGYSRLQEDRMPAFMFHFLQRVASHLPKSRGFVNTWGDAIFALMDGATPLAEFALALQDVVCGTDWTQYGLPAGMSVRVGLHAGPVYEGLDPITGSVNYYGAHVNRAARIEPITIPGNVYASEQFAALLTAEQWATGQTAFACDYIGTLTLDKDYGSQSTYHLRRSH
jgi:pilus assembly protein FimV